MKADHNTITPFGIKVMSKYKVLSKREHGMTLTTSIFKSLRDCFKKDLSKYRFFKQ